LLKKKTQPGADEDVLVNHSPSVATGDDPSPEVASPPSSDHSLAPSLAPGSSVSDLDPPPPVSPSPSTERPPHFDMQLPGVPVAQLAPVVLHDPALEERIRHLESLLSQVQNLQSLEQRVAERVASQIQRQPPAPAPGSTGPSVLGQARALIDVGRNLLPALPPGDAPPRPRGWLIWEMIAEVRAMVCMYLDPRYRVSLLGYVVPPILFVAFMFTKWWLPFALMLEKAGLAWIIVVPVDLLLLYAMFKVLGYEARRYRETAPDLPPSLRL
jgi:hypothetical protein